MCGDKSYTRYSLDFPNGMLDVVILQVKRLEEIGKRVEAIIAESNLDMDRIRFLCARLIKAT